MIFVGLMQKSQIIYLFYSLLCTVYKEVKAIYFPIDFSLTMERAKLTYEKEHKKFNQGDL